jgi:hypothetical protein
LLYFGAMGEVAARRRNWLLLAGFLVALFAFLSYFLLFVNFPLTRNFPWANLLLFAVAEILLAVGIVRAFRQADAYKGKVLGPVLSGLSTLILAGFIFVVLILARKLPASTGAPHVGTKAPEFTLLDADSKPVSLADLLATPQNGALPKGVLLVFYRGYW